MLCAPVFNHLGFWAPRYNPGLTELMEISIPAKTAQPMTFYSEHRVLGGRELVIQVQELPFPHAIGIRVTDAESGEAVKVTDGDGGGDDDGSGGRGAARRRVW